MPADQTGWYPIYAKHRPPHPTTSSVLARKLKEYQVRRDREREREREPAINFGGGFVFVPV